MLVVVGLALLLVPHARRRLHEGRSAPCCCSACVSSFLSLAFGRVDVGGRPFRAGGYLGEWLARLVAEYLNRTGSIIVILTLLFLAIILSTQFSFGRAVQRSGVRDRDGRRAGASEPFREWREERRRDKQRREVHREAHTKTARRAGAGRTRDAKPTKTAAEPPPGGAASARRARGPARTGARAVEHAARRSQTGAAGDAVGAASAARCADRDGATPSGGGRATRCRRWRCSTRRRPNTRSTSAS